VRYFKKIVNGFSVIVSLVIVGTIAAIPEGSHLELCLEIQRNGLIEVNLSNCDHTRKEMRISINESHMSCGDLFLGCKNSNILRPEKLDKAPCFRVSKNIGTILKMLPVQLDPNEGMGLDVNSNSIQSHKRLVSKKTIVLLI